MWLGDRAQRMQDRATHAQRPPARRQYSPRFALYDQSSPPQIVKFERYLGRTQLVVVFFDGETGADRDPWLEQRPRELELLRAERFAEVCQAMGFQRTPPVRLRVPQEGGRRAA